MNAASKDQHKSWIHTIVGNRASEPDKLSGLGGIKLKTTTLQMRDCIGYEARVVSPEIDSTIQARV